MTLSEVSKTLFCIFFHIFYWKHTEIANHPSPFTFSTKIPTNKQLTAVKGWLNPSPPFTTLHHPSRKRLRVYTIVVFSFIRTFAPSF